MKKALLLLVTLGGLVAALAWFFFSQKEDAPLSMTDASVANLGPSMVPVDVRATNDSGLTVFGRVVDVTGTPVPDAEVSLSSSSQMHLQTLRCNECERPLLDCRAHATSLVLEEYIRQKLHVPQMAMQTRSDEKGEFRFDGLKGVSFTVWARAQNLGDAVRERVAPLEKIELVLPALRRVFGKVMAEDGATVPNASVHVLSTKVSTAHQSLTDSSGEFSVEGLGEGPFVVLTEAKGFLPRTTHSVQPGKPLSIRLERTQNLRVKVRRDGQPVEAWVQVKGDHLRRQGVSNRGEVQFERLFRDEVAVWATLDSWASPVSTLLLDKFQNEIELELTKGGGVEAQVLDENQQPIDRAQLSLRRQDGVVLQSQTAVSGNSVRFEPINPGDFQLNVEAEGFETQTVPVTVTSGETTFLQVTLPTAIQVTGVVVDESGRPAPGVSVLVSPIGQNVFAKDDGSFVAEVPSEGLYTLQAHHSMWGGGEVKVTAPATGVELVLSRKASVEVTVSAQGKPIEGAHVVMMVENQGTFRSDTPSAADGKVYMRGMPNGTYVWVATHEEFLPSERQTITLQESDDIRLTAELKEGTRIVGTVVDDVGKPVQGASVRVYPRHVEASASDVNGKFETSPLPQAVGIRLEAQHPMYESGEPVVARVGGTAPVLKLRRKEMFSGKVFSDAGAPIRRFVVNGQWVDSVDGRFQVGLLNEKGKVLVSLEANGFEPVTEEREAREDLGEFVLKAAPSFSGRVVDAAGQPVVEATVSCDGCGASKLTGLDGRFTLSRPSFSLPLKVHAQKGSLSATKEMPSGENVFVELVLQQKVRLEGVIYSANGMPASGSQVEFVTMDLMQSQTLVTGPDGVFTTQVSPGTYRFEDVPGARLPVTRMVVVSGTQARLNLGPVPGTTTLTVRVKPTPGHALWLVPGAWSSVGNPPSELSKVHEARLWYQPTTSEVTFVGVAPGLYTLVWGSFHNATPQGPRLFPVSVPSQQVVVE